MLLRFSRILLVDDSAVVRKLVRAMLAELGLENVDEAGDGNEALRLIGRRRYGLIISDWIMTPMSGLELLRALRRSDAHANLPFVMMTTQSQVKFTEVARDAGSTHYLAKPFDKSALQTKLDSLRDPGETKPFLPQGTRRVRMA